MNRIGDSAVPVDANHAAASATSPTDAMASSKGTAEPVDDTVTSDLPRHETPAAVRDHNGGTRDHGQRRQTIVQSVLAEVFQGKLRPGQHLVTQRLAERFGVSHTPVREALISLAGIGIVDLVPNRGAIVRSVSEKDVREICQVRKVLECEAVRLSCGRIPLAALHEISASLRRMDQAFQQQPEPQFIQEARRVDSTLHDLIAESTGNRFLTQELNRLKMLFRAFRDVAWEHDEARDDYHRLAEEGREHAAIVQALLASDARLAARSMSRHIRSGLKYWSRALPISNSDPTQPTI